MELKQWRGLCLCPLDGVCPPEAVPVETPFAPLVFLVRRDPLHSRGLYAISSLGQLQERETPALLGRTRDDASGPLAQFVTEHGAAVLNTCFAHGLSLLLRLQTVKSSGLRVTLAGLGDVGGMLLTALKLLGDALSEIMVYDPDEALCRRYELELNQVLERPFPRVTLCPAERLFDCDLFLFTASRGVPPVGSGVQDVRMAQFRKNREILCAYARQARSAGFQGLFCQISDPVDQLSRVAFLESNRDENGVFDGGGLLPEQVQGFGLGVMAARAAYFAERMGCSPAGLRAYGPHGAGLVIANDPLHYDPALSARLTEATLDANLKVRELGYKPYIAPALSSAALSILDLLRGRPHYGAISLGGAYFGCRSCFTRLGVLPEREPMARSLLERLEETHRRLEAFAYDD